MAIKVRFKDGSVQTVNIPVPAPESLGSLEECDYIDNWLADNMKQETEGWFV
jgi:hypothetical protein